MKNPDWVVHNVLDKPVSFHTHGLNKYGSLEIEIVLPLCPEEGIAFCNRIGAAIADGLKLEDGLMVDGLFPDGSGCGRPVYFFKVKPIHGDKDVFRAIFPDPNGLLPWEQFNGDICAEAYKGQITFTEDMCFFIITEDTARVEESGTDFGSVFYAFEKRENYYIRPAQYFVLSLNEIYCVSPYINTDIFEIRRFVQKLKSDWHDAKNVKVVCKPVDYSDPMHKSFKEFIWKYKK